MHRRPGHSSFVIGSLSATCRNPWSPNFSENPSTCTGVSPLVESDSYASVGVMAQPHKGPRRLVQSRVAPEVHAEIAHRASAAGMSVSQWIADIVSLSVGRPDLVRELNRAEGEELPLAI